MLDRSSNRVEQNEYSLRLHRVGLLDLGPYTCQAYSGTGQPASFTVVARAIGPVAPATNAKEQDLMRYVVNAPQPPPPETYYRTPPPGGVYRPRGEETTTTPRGRLSAMQVSISLRRTRFALNSVVTIPCRVYSMTTPTVFWSKNGRRLRTDDRRVRMLRDGSNALRIERAQTFDSGAYTCSADNGYASASDTANIVVENVEISGECTDNPYFANCKLIVKAEYCTNKYYSKFCCHSCTLAGQLG